MTWVVKLGGSLLEDEGRLDALCGAVARRARGEPTVLVHGGGRRLSALSSRLGLQPRFERGLRVTDDATLEAALMALAGSVNKSVAAALCRAGARAVGISGGDGLTAAAERLAPSEGIDLGHVGRVASVRPDLLERLLAAGFLPVVASLALSVSGRWLNVNADEMASALARALGARRLVFLTDVAGVLDARGRPLRRLDAAAALRLIGSGVAAGGMRPKLQACVEALQGGVPEIWILPGEEGERIAPGRGRGEVGTLLTADRPAEGAVPAATHRRGGSARKFLEGGVDA